jgi:hypothetical protein
MNSFSVQVFGTMFVVFAATWISFWIWDRPGPKGGRR